MIEQCHSMMQMMGMGGTMMGPMLLLVLLAGLGLIGGTVYLVRRPAGGMGPEHAGTILDERLARGEIDIEEYWERQSVLKGH